MLWQSTLHSTSFVWATKVLLRTESPKMCLHLEPWDSWSGQEQWGTSPISMSYRPFPACEGTDQVPSSFLRILSFAAISNPRCCLGSITSPYITNLSSGGESGKLIFRNHVFGPDILL